MRLPSRSTLFPYTTLFRSEMAVADYGGKVAGKPIEVVGADHQNKPDVGANIARTWYDADKVDTIVRSEEHTSELQSHVNLVCRLLLEKKNSRAQHNLIHTV